MLSTSAASPVLVFVAYLLGSIPFGLILTKLLGGKDVRQHGSGNIGATNVTRVAGPVAGILTLLLDASKGAAAVWLAGHFTGHSARWMVLAGAAALAGHCFPVWLAFNGGKGVATALGVFVMLSPIAALAGFALFLLIFVFWRYVSLASITAAAAMPLLTGPLPWLILRAVIGFGCSGLFIATESWLNAKAEPTQRGRVFSAYMFGTFLALALGQLLIGKAKVETAEPFNAIAVLFAVALVIVSTTRAEPPHGTASTSLPFAQLSPRGARRGRRLHGERAGQRQFLFARSRVDAG